MNERSAVAGQVAVPNEHLCRLAGNCLQHQLNTHNYTRSPALGRERSHRDSGRGVASSAHRRPSFILHPRPRRWRSRLTPRPYPRVPVLGPWSPTCAAHPRGSLSPQQARGAAERGHLGPGAAAIHAFGRTRPASVHPGPSNPSRAPPEPARDEGEEGAP